MEDIKEHDEPCQTPNKRFVFDFNKFDYSLPEPDSKIDFNKLFYGDEQISEFVIKKNANYMPPESYFHLFKPELTPWEEHILIEKGVDLDKRVIPEEPVFLVSTYIPKHEAGANGECGIHEDPDRNVYGAGNSTPLFKKKKGFGVII